MPLPAMQCPQHNDSNSLSTWEHETAVVHTDFLQSGQVQVSVKLKQVQTQKEYQ